MDKNKVYDIKPGKEKDALIAESVMGWVWVAFRAGREKDSPIIRKPYPPDSCEPSREGNKATGNEPLAKLWHYDIPNYSTDIAAAFEVHTHLLSQDPAIKAAYLHALADVLTDKYSGPPSVWTAPLECFNADTISCAALIAAGEEE